MAQIRQRYGDRVLVVTTDTPDRLAGLAGVTLVTAHGAAPEGGDDFTETERMGLAAWNARAAFATKVRPGDGLPWDTKGFAAP